MQEKILIIFPSILIALLPLTLISGPFLSDLSVVLIGIFFLINVFKNKDYEFFNNIFFKIFFVFFIYLLINSVIKFYDIHNIRSSVTYIRFGLFFMGVYYFLEKKPNLIKWLFFVFFFSFSILIIDGYLQYFFKTNFFNIAIEQGRITSLFRSEHILGSYLSRLFPIFLALTFLLYKNNKQYILAISLLFILIEILIFLSGERSAFFFNTLAAIFVIIMLKDFKKIRFLSFIISIGIILLITKIDDSAKKRIWDQTVDQMGINSSNINLFSEGHESHYNAAYRMFEDNRIFGIGIRNFRNFCNDKRYTVSYKNAVIPYKIMHERSCTTHPHNTYIQLLSETGLIGFSFIFLLLVYFIHKILKHLVGVIRFKKYYFNDFEICLLSAILISIWPLVPSGNFFNNWLSIIYYFPVGFLMWSLKKSK